MACSGMYPEHNPMLRPQARAAFASIPPPRAPARLAIFCLVVAATTARGADTSSFPARWEQLKARLSNEDLYRLMWALPKGGDIHNHHEYSVPMSFWLDGASRRNYYTRFKIGNCGESDALQWLTLRKDSLRKLPDCQQRDFTLVSSLTESQRRAWISALTLDETESRDEFFERIVRRLGDLERDPQLMAEALVLAQRQLQAENAIYLETQSDPRGFNGLTEDQAAASIRRRLAQPDSVSTHVPVRMQVSALRFAPDAEADLIDGFAFVHRNRDLWVGVNLVGREDNPEGRPMRFDSVLRDLRRKYPDVRLSLHAGESSTADSHVAQTIALGADRIGHGTNAYLDPNAINLLRSGRYLIEVSLISNQMLRYVPDLSKHPFPRYLRQGIPVCLNTDDRGVMDSNLTDEYFAAVSLFNMTWPEVVQIGRWSLEFSFAETPLKKELLARYAKNISAFEQTFLAAAWEQPLSRVRPQPSASTPRLFKLREKVGRSPRIAADALVGVLCVHGPQLKFTCNLQAKSLP
jgi:adenosine deaminase CECR1